ncbi:Pal1 cell morphology protein-domain-containing protein [Elsinoe ampelina]|uniref:Pal1 cell morphology protein-domain-containing protein n=1 Tax=Elsinoe ampelina TaxID=302913 RepID=A0A6A6G3Z7_9PEZI|nr:Pal1 cell morphology protein-domain-containing protein [Elsinoe ampelina]
MDTRFQSFSALFANYPSSQREPAGPNRPPPSGPPGRNGPPHPRAGPPPPPGVPGHRHSRSGDHRNGPPRPMRPRPNGDRNGPDSPDKSRQRRNSDSSLMEKDKAEEDRRRRERRKEREARREKEGKSKDARTKSGRRPFGLDVIDKLDVTGIYGQGLFHHDGPFDACNPHRNRKNNQRAPMQAFPENSANNALGGGSAPRAFNYDQFHGREEESFREFAASGYDYTTQPKRMQDKVATLIDPTGRGEQIHGDESSGLGTSTFLEGAPASRSAVQRRESDNDPPAMNGTGNAGGLGRKKSLAMRIRGLSQPRRPGEVYNGRVTSPDGYGPKSPESPPSATQSAGGPIRARPMGQEKNPFFGNDHDDAYDRKGARIEASEATDNSRRGGSSSPRAAPQLTRAVTTDSAPTNSSFDREEKASGGGFINRMKSLKGGKRPRPEIKS